MYENEIKILREQLTMDMDDILRIEKVNLLRYYLSEEENAKKTTKVRYIEEKDNLEYSESVQLAIILCERLDEIIKKQTDIETMQKLYKIMQENYYYLARYLFSYFAVAIEFGIEKSKQFLAPRTCVLNYINWELTKFYYKDRGIMTISMPQGTGKTEDSKRFMAFAIGNNPELPNMMVSYSANIAKDKFYNGIDAIINDDMGNFKKIFPNFRELYRSSETMSLDFTNDPNRKKPHSEYTLYCAGFDGSITGRTRAHGILYVDDLIKNLEEANNKDVLDKKWEEFTGTLKKRMQGHCKLLIVGTIFSIHDPISRLIEYYKEKEPHRIKVVKIPGLNENNESNFNYGYGYAITTKMFLEDKDLMEPVAFECLIQQNPIEREGILFNEASFKKFRSYPRDKDYVRTVAAIDVAWGGGDSLSMPIIDEHSNGDCPLIDVYFSKAAKEETIPNVVGKIIEHHITNVFIEANNGGDMYAEAVQEELKKKGINDCYIHWKKAPTIKSKRDRILEQQGAIKGSSSSEYRLLIKTRDSIKENRDYNDFLNEVFKFSQSDKAQGKQHDDAPDSLASVFSNVLECTASNGTVYSHFSREELGI